MNVKLYNQNAEEVGTVELPDRVFGLPWNADLVHQVVMSQLSNQRPKVAHTKDRSEVRGGGKKPWRQKGTGRARHGSTRSPIWKGGGVTHGPRVEKNFKRKINKQMAKKALWTVLSAKARDHEIVVVDDLVFPEPKTKYGAEFLKKMAGRPEFVKMTKGNGLLVALTGKNPAVERALRNLPSIDMDQARNLNALETLQYKYILFPKSALGVFKI